MRKILFNLTVLFSLVPFAALAGPSSFEEDFHRASELYETREYDEAINRYLHILDQGMESSALYFNLGSAYFKNGDLGHAILHYLRAKRLDPGDDDIASNLEFAMSFTRVQMAGVELNPVEHFLETLVEPYRLSTLAWVSSAAFILLICLLIVRYGIGVQNVGVRTATTVVVVLLVLFTFVSAFKYRHDYLTSRAVLIAQDCPVRTGPSEQSDIELEGAPGLVVEILSKSGDYYNVLFQNKRRGWIWKELVAVV